LEENRAAVAEEKDVPVFLCLLAKFVGSYLSQEHPATFLQKALCGSVAMSHAQRNCWYQCASGRVDIEISNNNSFHLMSAWHADG